MPNPHSRQWREHYYPLCLIVEKKLTIGILRLIGLPRRRTDGRTEAHLNGSKLLLPVCLAVSA